MATSQDIIKEKHVLSYKNFRRFLPFNGVIYLAMYMRSAFLTGYGAAWFAGCKTVKSDNNCDKDGNYEKFNFYFQLSNSILSLFAFVCAGIIGHLSDIYGRKLFLYLQIITSWMPYIVILFTNNMYIFLALLTLIGLNGSLSPLCPVQLAYIADSLPTHKRLSGYATIFLIGGSVFLIGTGFAFIIAALINDHFNFYVINVLFLIDLLYLIKFVKEPKKEFKDDIDPKKTKKIVSYNPFRPFRYLCKNNVILWISLSSSFFQLESVGLIDIAVVMFSDAFNASEETSNVISIVFIAGFSIGMILSPIAILPFLRKCLSLSEFQILIFTLSLLIINIILMAFVLFIHSYCLIFLSSLTCGVGVLSITVYPTILTTYCDEKEKGIGLGVMASCNAISTMIAPFGFALSYNYLKNHNLEFIFFIAALCLGIIGFLLCIPLKYAMNSAKKYGNIEKNSNVENQYEKQEKLLLNATHLGDKEQPIFSKSLSLQPALK